MDLKNLILPEAAVLVTGLRSGGIFISDKIGILTCWATLHVPVSGLFFLVKLLFYNSHHQMMKTPFPLSGTWNELRLHDDGEY